MQSDFLEWSRGKNKFLFETHEKCLPDTKEELQDYLIGNFSGAIRESNYREELTNLSPLDVIYY